MKKLFLTSSFYAVADKFKETIPNVSGMTVAFIPTAGDLYDSKPWMDADRQALVDLGMDVEDINIKGMSEGDIYAALTQKDAIFVAGGNTFYLLQHSRHTGFGLVVRNLVEKGKLYIGSSAGSVLAGPTIEPVDVFDDPKEAPDLVTYDGLSLVDFVVLPHYSHDKPQKEFDEVLTKWNGKVQFQLLCDHQAVLVEGNSVKIL